MYEIRPETAKTFVMDRGISLPRFQRKQTWDEKKNFQLCISVFKGYPLGVCIINIEKEKEVGRTKKFLLDGRQRRNALTQMFENPEVIGIWGKKFLGFKSGIDQYELSELFEDKINNYLEADEDSEDETTNEEEIDDNYSEESEDEFQEDLPEKDVKEGGLKLLREILLLTYKKTKHATGFTAPFDFTKYLKNLPYVDSDGTNAYNINGKKIKSFIDEYRTDCENNNLAYNENSDVFAKYLMSRSMGGLKDGVTEAKFKSEIKKFWDEICERFKIVEKMDDIMSNCYIGLILVKGFKPADSQKIFNIINSEGVKLTAVEILSAKSYWNIKITNPSGEMLKSAENLYSNMDIKINDVYRWDIPATLLERLGENVIFKSLSWDSSKNKAEFEKKLTLGFKLMSGIYEKGIKKEDIDAMGKDTSIDWNIQSEETIRGIKSVIKLIEDFSYFRRLKTWKISMMELTSDAIALNFILLMYFDWKRKGEPWGAGTKIKQFQKNAFILWDQLIYEYVLKQWRGSSDSKVANNIKEIDNTGDVFAPLAKDKWAKLLQDIIDTNKVNDANVTIALMKPILYHMYCINEIKGPDFDYAIEVDHIIPQSEFKSSTIPGKEVVQDNLYNLGLLPKQENIYKSNRMLNEINERKESWLIEQIEKYEFIDKAQFDEFSSVGNYKKLFKFKKKSYDEAFGPKRDKILNG